MSAGPESLRDWLERHAGPVGLVFTDVVASTLLLFENETVDYRQLLRAHLSHAADVVRAHGGRLVEESRDELLAAFPDATRAYGFAHDIFHDPGHPKVRIRAGVHYGQVSAEGDALVGRSVHLGARVMQHGQDRELWLSDAAKLALEDESPERAAGIEWLARDDCALKGIPEQQRLWRVA